MDSSFTFRLLLTFLAVACCCRATSIGRSSSRFPIWIVNTFGYPWNNALWFIAKVSKRSVIEVDNPEETLRVLGSLAQRIIDAETISNDKRGLDLGLSRGFSGSQAAKHLMGLSAASFANGPGRRRREAQN